MATTPVSLLERLSARPDAATWQRFVELYAPLIQGWLRRQRLPEVDIEDLSQDVLAVVIREVPRFRHDGRIGAFRSWLRTVTVNRLRHLWRTQSYREQGTGDSDFLHMLDQLEDSDSLLSRQWDQEHDQYLATRLMQIAESDFEPTTWRAFRRVALEGARAAEVAAEQGISVNAVLLAKSRVLQRLRQEARGLLDL